MTSSALAPPPAPPEQPGSAGPAPAARPEPAPRGASLAAEVRESLLLLGLAVVTTVGLTTAAQAALAALH